jgi:transposase InsO family protein
VISLGAPLSPRPPQPFGGNPSSASLPVTPAGTIAQTARGLLSFAAKSALEVDAWACFPATFLTAAGLTSKTTHSWPSLARSHRTDGDDFYRLLDGVVLDGARLFTTKLQEWEDFYNFDRLHGAWGGQTAYERLRQKTEARVLAAIVSCTARHVTMRRALLPVCASPR